MVSVSPKLVFASIKDNAPFAMLSRTEDKLIYVISQSDFGWADDIAAYAFAQSANDATRGKSFPFSGRLKNTRKFGF